MSRMRKQQLWAVLATVIGFCLIGLVSFYLNPAK